MDKGFVAQAKTTINAPISKVWDYLVNPDLIKQYMFGTTVVTDWKEGSSIIWKGEWQGKAYEDKGKILKIEPEKLLVVTHYSPLTGAPDVPENYHTVRYELTKENDNQTAITLTQDNNVSEEEKEHSQKNWEMFLQGLKTLVEK